jgi:hypothetical protein
MKKKNIDTPTYYCSALYTPLVCLVCFNVPLLNLSYFVVFSSIIQ